MNLVCPHCAKVVEIAPDLAGKTTTCPKCAGPFTVPLVPPDMLTAMTGTKEKKEEGKEEKTVAKVDASSTTSGVVKPDPVAAAMAKDTPEPPPIYPPALSRSVGSTSGQGVRLILAVPRQALPFIAPVCFLLLIVLLFVPWVGVYAGQTMLVEQSGFGVAFGLVSHHEQVTNVEGVGMSFYMFLNFLAVILGLATTVGELIANYAPPHRQQQLGRVGPWLVGWRPQLLCAFALVAFLCIGLLLFAPLPLEAEATGKRAQQLQKEGLKIKFEEGLKVKIDPTSGNVPTDMLETQWIRRTWWFTLVFILNFLAFLGALVDWHCVRNKDRPLPHLEIVWGEHI